MAEPFYGEIKQFGFDWAPFNYAKCDGALLSANDHAALFALIGNKFGGDGPDNFALPDFRGRVPVMPDGQTILSRGQFGGYEAVTLTNNTLPPHRHAVIGRDEEGTSFVPIDGYFCNTGITAATGTRLPAYAFPIHLKPFAGNFISSYGGNGAHNNMQPSLAINFCIAMTGCFPPRG